MFFLHKKLIYSLKIVKRIAKICEKFLLQVPILMLQTEGNTLNKIQLLLAPSVNKEISEINSFSGTFLTIPFIVLSSAASNV